MVTLDIVSMYTNTTHNEAMESVDRALNQERSSNDCIIKQPTTKYMIAMLKMILKNNTFKSTVNFTVRYLVVVRDLKFYQKFPTLHFTRQNENNSAKH